MVNLILRFSGGFPAWWPASRSACRPLPLRADRRLLSGLSSLSRLPWERKYGFFVRLSAHDADASAPGLVVSLRVVGSVVGAAGLLSVEQGFDDEAGDEELTAECSNDLHCKTRGQELLSRAIRLAI